MNAKAIITAGAAGALALVIGNAALAQQPARPSDPLQGRKVAVTLVTSEGVTLAEDDHGVMNSRTLKFGEEYAPGWKLDSATSLGVALRNGATVRVLPYAEQQTAAGVDADAARADGKVNLTNAVAGARSPGAASAGGRARALTVATPAQRAQLNAAVTAGDAKEAFYLGGSAAEVAQALAASSNNSRMSEMLATGGEASFVSMNGSTGVRVSSGADGRSLQMVSVPPQLQGVTPPADATVLNPPPPSTADQVSTDGQGNTLVRRTFPAPTPAPGQ